MKKLFKLLLIALLLIPSTAGSTDYVTKTATSTGNFLFSIDPDLGSSDTTISSQNAVKSYFDNHAAPVNSFFLITRDVPALTNAINLGTLSTGLLKVTVNGGVAVPSIAVDGVDYASMATVTGPASGFPIATAGGTVDIITASYTPALTLSDKRLCAFVASGANTSATPTFAPDGLTAHPIVKAGGAALVAGEIPASQAVCLLEYNLANTRWELLNPATVTAYLTVPVGAMMTWPTETPPAGWLERNGASLDRTTYAALFAVIGTIYGAADGTHFNLPNHRGRFPRYWAHGQTTDPDKATRTAVTPAGATMTAGDHVGTEQVEGFKSHQHNNLVDEAGKNLGNAGGSMAGTVNGYTIDTNGVSSYWLTTAAGGNETRPINDYEMPIIKY